MERRKKDYKSLGGGGSSSRLQRLRDDASALRRQAADAALQQRRRLRALPLEEQEEQRRRLETADDVATAVDGIMGALSQALAERQALDPSCVDRVRELRRLVASADEAATQAVAMHIASDKGGGGGCNQANAHVLKELLQVQSPDVKGEALWIISNMTGILPPEVSLPFVRDLVPPALSALDPSANDQSVVKQAAWLVANIAALDDSAAAQQLSQLIVSDQALSHLAAIALALRQPWPSDVTSTAAWSLSNVVRANPGAVQTLEGLCGGPQALAAAGAKILSLHAGGPPPDPDSLAALQELLWVLCFLSASCSSAMSQAVVDAGWLPALTQLLQQQRSGFDSSSLQVPCVRTLGNILGATGEGGAMLFISDPIRGIDCLAGLLRPDSSPGPSPLLRKDAIWVLSQVAGRETTAHAVLGDAIAPVLAATMASSPFHIRQEAAWTLMTACLHAQPQVVRAFLCRSEILSLIHSTMSRQSAAADEDLSFVFLSFEERALALGNDLVLAVEASNGIEALENISMSSELPLDLSEFASKLIDTYYGEDYGEDGEASPPPPPDPAAYPSWRIAQ